MSNHALRIISDDVIRICCGFSYVFYATAPELKFKGTAGNGCCSILQELEKRTRQNLMNAVAEDFPVFIEARTLRP